MVARLAGLLHLLLFALLVLSGSMIGVLVIFDDADGLLLCLCEVFLGDADGRVVVAEEDEHLSLGNRAPKKFVLYSKELSQQKCVRYR